MLKQGVNDRYEKAITIKDTEYIITEHYSHQLELKDIVAQILWLQYQSNNMKKSEV